MIPVEIKPGQVWRLMAHNAEIRLIVIEAPKTGALLEREDRGQRYDNYEFDAIVVTLKPFFDISDVERSHLLSYDRLIRDV